MGIVSLDIEKSCGACALTHAGGSIYIIKLKSDCREPDLSLSGLDPVSLSKIETHACLRWSRTQGARACSTRAAACRALANLANNNTDNQGKIAVVKV